MINKLIAKVAVENTTYSFDSLFDYLVPEEFVKSITQGMRVKVPFGRGNQKRVGMVFSLCEVLEYSEKIKYIQGLLDDSPIISDEMLKIALWIK